VMSYFAAFARTKPTYARAEATLRRARTLWRPLPRAGGGSERRGQAGNRTWARTSWSPYRSTSPRTSILKPMSVRASSQYVRVLWANGGIQNISGLPQGLAGRTAAGWRRQGDGAGNKWRDERVYALTKLPLAGVLPWLSRPSFEQAAEEPATTNGFRNRECKISPASTMTFM